MEKHEITIINTQGELKTAILNPREKNQFFLGRDASVNDIIIPDRIISKNHGIFRFDRNQLFYSDCGSTNGTYIENYNQRRLIQRQDGFIPVHEKTILKIGDLKHPERMVVMIYRISSGSEIWKKQVMNRGVLSIGRDSSNDIVLKHPGVLRTHCRVFLYGNQAVLQAAQQKHGITVNGENMGSTRELKDKDIIQLLGYQLIYSSTCIYYLSEREGIYLKVCDVNKYVGRGNKKKQILHQVDCEIRGNEFVAIIGGSGAGKSTLMNAISGFDKNFEGVVYCNGMDLVKHFQAIKDIIGYVPQQDIIYENLTLKKMLFYTAKMKMSEDTSREEIKRRIDEVLSIVDLKEHENTFIRKLSGGQKKRASIAVELLADPKLFFLDEPTSGLDPGTEKKLMETLKALSKKQNKTVVMVTHTTQNLHLCDKIIFMGPGGRLCFCGDVEEAKKYFNTEDLVNIYNLIGSNVVAWENQYKNYSKSEFDLPMETRKSELIKGRKISGVRQFFILAKRYAELIVNDKLRFLILLLQPLLIGILLFVVASDDVFDVYESTKSMLFSLSCSGIWIGLFDSIQEVCKERVILKREYMANLKLPGYILSKFLVLSVLGAAQAAILTAVFMKLVRAEGAGIWGEDLFFETLITMWITILASIALGLIISCIVKSSDKAMTIAPFALIIQLLFSGILFDLKGAGKIISYFTVSRWSVEGLGSIAHLNDLNLKMQQEFPMLEHEAESFFEASGKHLACVWMILIFMICICCFAGMTALKSVSKDSR